MDHSDSAFEQSPDAAREAPARDRAQRPIDFRPHQRTDTQSLLEAVEAAGLAVPEPPTRAQLLLTLMQGHAARGSELIGSGILEILPDGFGFLRNPSHDFVPDVDDFYVSPAQIQRFALRVGDLLTGSLRSPRGSEANFAILKLRELEGQRLTANRVRLPFEELTATPAERPLRFAMLAEDSAAERDAELAAFDKAASCRHGSRILLAGPPRAGATSWLLKLAQRASRDDATRTCALLLDVRPEEANEFRQIDRCFVAAADTTTKAEAQLRVARLGIERAKRLVEAGEDVVVFVDSLGAYARAVSHAEQAENPRAGPSAKQLFATARETKEAGSLTMIASLRLDGDDDAFHRELSRTSDSEVQLDSL